MAGLQVSADVRSSIPAPTPTPQRWPEELRTGIPQVLLHLCTTPFLGGRRRAPQTESQRQADLSEKEMFEGNKVRSRRPEEGWKVGE